ncbi:NAD-dependent epimerase/dehydratase family protein [Xylophilus sp. GOD-11R]|uniref:NAD-dependent epimerase/dehydratase family protein n=1 Tax=Xylophilus sp. GOD-11R TaxID=3089814 RepID=UPI00298BF32C|nr:NAD-dependent epimerase/dehydratase family protein [Xylophilus sp. GOD-11R]WPB57913.1 GDP-mannose 4,6-dehydratase [Xylophilus sp. GOD-11R]
MLRNVHLAAQPSVRYSITHPHAYAKDSLVAFLSILKRCRDIQVQHLIYASSSSVSGGNAKVPFFIR